MNLDEALTYNTYGEINDHVVDYSATTKYSYDLTRDSLGRITSMTENILGTATTYNYSYDSNGRLDEVQENSVIVGESTFGTNSTRTSGKVNGTTFTATYDGYDRLTDWNDLDFAYNDNGELTSKTNTSTTDVTSFTWSPFGKLETVTLPNSDVITYKYDGFGRKALVLLDGTVEYALLYESQLRPVAQMDSSGNLIARFVWGQKINTPEYMIKSGVKYRLVTDPRGSVRLVLKADDGTVAQRIDYNEWGEVTNDTSPGFQPFGYAGGLYDHRTGLTEFGARHYDGKIGRWLSKDPIGFAGGDTNLFSYVASDPINFIDVTGNFSIRGALSCGTQGVGLGAVVGLGATALTANPLFIPGFAAIGGAAGFIGSVGSQGLEHLRRTTGASSATGPIGFGSDSLGGGCGYPGSSPHSNDFGSQLNDRGGNNNGGGSGSGNRNICAQ